ncbi:MAG: ornithine cyclodeaminase family protein [Candidatus Aminicenantales bacterium]
MSSDLLYLSRKDVEAAGPAMPEIIAALEYMFREKAAGRVEMPPKPAIHTRPGTFINAMPASIAAIEAAGVKWVSSYPMNKALGLPLISGLLILNDVATGLPLTVMDCGWITAKRTGAATAVAAKFLARPESEVAGVLGCGVQGRGNIEALACVLPLKRVYAYDTDVRSREAFAEDVRRLFGLEAVPVEKPEQAVKGCDVVVTAGPITTVPHATIKAGWLEAGAFASLVDYDSYWERAALREADKFCTDDIPQFEHYRSLGSLRDVPAVYAEVGELVAGIKPGRESREERTMACNLGMALDDIAVAAIIYRRALEKGLGIRLPL